MNEAMTTSVVAVLVAVVVTTLAHAADPIAPVPSADVPLAMVDVRPPADESVAATAVATPVPGVAVASAPSAVPPWYSVVALMESAPMA